MKKITLLVVVLGFVFGFHSCKKDPINEIQIRESFSVFEAKIWLESKQSGDLVFKSGSKVRQKYKLQKNWEKAYKSSNEKVDVIEVPLIAETGFGFITSEAEELARSTGEFNYAKSETRLLFQKNKQSGEITAHFMTIMGDPEYLDITDFKVSSNKFLKKDDDFSGIVLFHQLNGIFNIGWRYTNGEITHIISSESTIESGLNLKSATEELACYKIKIFEVITYYIEYESGVTKITRIETNVLDSYYVCYYDSYIAGSGGGGTTPGEPIPEINAEDCNCIVCPVCGRCENVLLKGGTVLLPDDDDGVSGTTTTTNQINYNCPVCECIFEDPNKPCSGDPVKNSEISPTQNGSLLGGTYGCVRIDPDKKTCEHIIYNRHHNGVDIKAEIKSTLYNMHDGIVHDQDFSQTMGKYVRIMSNINGKNILIQYAHLSSIFVENGNEVKAGDVIGETGNSGYEEIPGTIPHVHIRLWENWNEIDPRPYFGSSFNKDGTLNSACNNY